MQPTTKNTTGLDDVKIHVKLKISALWVSVMFCYIYADYFGLFVPRALQSALEGKIGPFTTSQGVLLGTAALMVIPSVMIFLSLALTPKANRWVNMIFGVIYTIIIILTMPGAWMFYLFFGSVEVVLTATIVWYAWTWPKREVSLPPS